MTGFTGFEGFDVSATLILPILSKPFSPSPCLPTSTTSVFSVADPSTACTCTRKTQGCFSAPALRPQGGAEDSRCCRGLTMENCRNRIRGRRHSFLEWLSGNTHRRKAESLRNFQGMLSYFPHVIPALLGNLTPDFSDFLNNGFLISHLPPLTRFCFQYARVRTPRGPRTRHLPLDKSYVHYTTFRRSPSNRQGDGKGNGKW